MVSFLRSVFSSSHVVTQVHSSMNFGASAGRLQAVAVEVPEACNSDRLVESSSGAITASQFRDIDILTLSVNASYE